MLYFLHLFIVKFKPDVISQLLASMTQNNGHIKIAFNYKNSLIFWVYFSFAARMCLSCLG